jgi:mannitol-1-phosphate/altronate dehydrogenase
MDPINTPQPHASPESQEPLRLNVANIDRLAANNPTSLVVGEHSRDPYESPILEVADYIRDRSNIQVGIIAIGANSNFHRGLVASLAHDALKSGDTQSGICAVSLRSGVDDLRAQDGLFILNTRDHGKIRQEVVGSIVETVSLSNDADCRALGERFLDPGTKFITTVVTPTGYFLDGEGYLNTGAAEIKADLSHPHNPSTTIGVIVKGLFDRYSNLDESDAPMVVIPCDNFPPVRDSETGQVRGLGECLKFALIEYANGARLGDRFAGWIEKKVAVPNTQVDRICPCPDPEHTGVIRSDWGVDDQMTVTSEPFRSFVVEWRDPKDKMVSRYIDRNNKPAWLAQDGVVLAEDAKDWCEMKTYTVNLAHVMLAWMAKHAGQQDAEVHTFLTHPGVAKFVADTLIKCVGPNLDIPHHIRANSSYEKYVISALSRLQNFSLPDNLARLDTAGTQKMRTRVMPVVIRAEERAQEAHKSAPGVDHTTALKEVARLALVVAIWAKCVTTGVDKDGKEVRADNKDPSAKRWRSDVYGRLTDIDQVKAFLKEEDIFGETPDKIPQFALYFKTLLLCKFDKLSVDDLLGLMSNGADLHSLLEPHFQEIHELERRTGNR